MRNDPLFDPLFGDTPSDRRYDRPRDRKAFLFDGWSLQPLAVAPIDERVEAPAGRKD